MTMLKSIRHGIVAGLTALLLAWAFWPRQAIMAVEPEWSTSHITVRGTARPVDAGVVLIGDTLVRLYGISIHAGRECHYSVLDCSFITRQYMDSLLRRPGVEVGCQMLSPGKGVCWVIGEDWLTGLDIAELLLDEGLAYTQGLDVPVRYETAERHAWEYRKGVWASRKDLPGATVPRVELGR